VVIDHGRIIAGGTPSELKARTGAQTLAVRPRDREDLQIVVSAVQEITRSQPEVADDLVTAQVTDAAALPAVVRRLDDAEVDVAELTLRTSTLDEVFLALTGRRTDLEEVNA
jgi:oleandomycin transport system ATP-binding protein